MPPFFRVSARGFRDLRGRFSLMSRELVRARREAIRRAGRRAMDILQTTAPRRSGEFAKGIRYRTDDRGHRTTATIYVTGAHAGVLDFLRHGTAPHVIPRGGAPAQKSKGYPLSFDWENGPGGPGRYSFWAVHHPGTKPHPFLGNAATEIERLAREELSKVAASVARIR